MNKFQILSVLVLVGVIWEQNVYIKHYNIMINMNNDINYTFYIILIHLYLNKYKN